jgi:hypothetical protein
MGEGRVRKILGLFACAGAVLQAGPAAAQTEQQLRQAFEGKYVYVRMEMPASHRGVDVYPGRDPAVDFSSYSSRIREFGVALREGDRVLVTAVRVRKKNIEFQLGGGGYGTWGDDSGSVYVPSVDKSRREKDLEKEIQREKDPERRRRLERERDRLRDERHREERYRDDERRALEAQKKSEIAQKRLDAGSRVNLWLPEEQLKAAAPTPPELQRMLSSVIDFGDGDGRRRTAGSNDTRRDVEPRGAGELRRGLTLDEVHDMLGKPARTKAGKQGELATLTEWYEAGDRVTEVYYVSGVIVRFTTSSK